MADYTAIPAELTDALRGLSPFFAELATMIENVLPALSSMIPAIGTMVEAAEASQPEILAVIEAIKFLFPVIQSLAGKFQSVLGPILQQLADKVSTALAPVLSALAELLQAVLMPVIQALAPVLKDLAAAFGVLAVLVNPVGAATSRLSAAFDTLTGVVKSAFSALAKAVSFVASALGKLASGLLTVAGSVFSALKSGLIDPLSRAAGSLVSSVGNAARQFVAASFGMSGTTGALKMVSGATERFIGGITGGVESVARVITPFVQALNPNLVFGLNYAFRSLHATIGVALTPVVQVLASGVRQMAAALLPAAQALAPVLQKVATVITTFVVHSVQRFAQNILDMLPFLNMLADAAGTLVGAWEAVRATVFAFIDSLVTWAKGLFGGTGDSKDMLATFRDVLHRAVEAVIRFSVQLAKMFGFGDFVSNLKTQLTKFSEPVKGSGAAPAPQEVGFKGFEDITKTIAVAAFAAQAGGGVGAEDRSEREWLKQLADSLDEMKDGSNALQDWLSEKLDELTALKDAVVGFVEGEFSAVSDKVEEIEADVKELYKKVRDGVNEISGKYGLPGSHGSLVGSSVPGAAQ